MIDDQAVEQMHIVLAQSAEIQELVDGRGLQRQLRQAARLLRLIVLDGRWGQAVGAEIFANVGRVRCIAVAFTVCLSRRSQVRDKNGVEYKKNDLLFVFLFFFFRVDCSCSFTWRSASAPNPMDAVAASAAYLGAGIRATDVEIEARRPVMFII